MIYNDITVTLNRLKHEFESNIIYHLNNNDIFDISAWQALLITNIGNTKNIISKIKANGYYTGSNLTYNLKELNKNGYLEKIIIPTDERARIIQLTPKGLAVLDIIECVLVSHNKALNDIGITEKDMYDLNGMLKNFEKILLKR